MVDQTIDFVNSVNKEDLKYNYDSWKYEMCQDKRSHFSISIPDSWYVSSANLNKRENDEQNASLVIFKESKNSSAEIEVIEEKLKREITPEHWLNFLIATMERRVLFSRVYEQQCGNVMDCLVEDKGGKWVYRMFGLKNEDRILLIEARCRRDDYMDRGLSEVFYIANASFTFLEPSDWALAEQANTFSRALPGDFCLIYPDTWTLRELEGSNSSVARHIELKNYVDDNIAGVVVFSVYKKNTASECIEILDLDLKEKNGLKMNTSKLTLEEINLDAFEKSWSTEYQIEKKQKNSVEAEVKITIGSNSDAWYVVKLYTPIGEELADIWAVNQTAYEIILKWLLTPQCIQQESDKKAHNKTEKQ